MGDNSERAIPRVGSRQEVQEWKRWWGFDKCSMKARLRLSDIKGIEKRKRRAE